MATAARVSLEEYLHTSYRPDCEYLDGVLKEKSVVEFVHGEVQGLLFSWFLRHREEWGIRASVETRTQVQPGKVRLPDVVVVAADHREKGALTVPPLVAIEVLSPTDSYADLRGRAEDLWMMGVRNIWLIDPEHRTGEVWRDGYWQPAGSARIDAVGSPVYVDLEWLWAELER